jgi:hypothetical protein
MSYDMCFKYDNDVNNGIVKYQTICECKKATKETQ